MTQLGTAPGTSGRALALARRKALSGAGKVADRASTTNRTRSSATERKAAVAESRSAPVSNRPTASAAAPGRRATIPDAVTPGGNVSRAAALARRRAMSSKGKVAAENRDRVRDGARGARPGRVDQAPPLTDAAGKGDCGCGCEGKGDCNDSPARAAAAARPATSPVRNGRGKLRAPRRNDTGRNPGRTASMARRRAQSSRGKAGISASGMSSAQTARAGNPDLSSRELARAVREQRSQRGRAGQKKSAPTGRQRASRSQAPQAGAQDAPWKVGASETARGQVVTGTMVGRSRDVTGDEASTCRTVTGTEYMGADIFRDFCQSEPSKGFNRVGVSPTRGGNRVSGNEVGRSTKVTGDEPGTCKNVTGTEYLGADQFESFCNTRPSEGPAKRTRAETRGGKTVTGNNVGRSAKVTGDETGANRTLTGTQYMQRGDGGAPAKVGNSNTLRGGAVTGTMVGRHRAMTGDEPGSCRNVTGNDYVGQEQFGEFCDSIPKPADRKVGVSNTLSGERVTGTMTGRGGRVTGDEPGTCKAITGTPYAGAEQYGAFCEPVQANAAAARMQDSRRRFGAPMTGIQPSVGGTMTGDARGACEPVTGTPYVGTDQAAAACPATAAEPGAPDFPQAIGGMPWGDFSVVSPAQAARPTQAASGVTGLNYAGGHITGPFDMAAGKVTGTEEARFGQVAGRVPAAPTEAGMVDGRVKSRITGEGIDAGHKITGDDWDRGDRVTGTEGTSAMARNPSRRGPAMSMAAAMAHGRPDDVPNPVSKVTGGSGNTDKGALITYSGGARG